LQITPVKTTNNGRRWFGMTDEESTHRNFETVRQLRESRERRIDADSTQ